MKNIFLIPTDKPSRLWTNTIAGKLVLDKEPNELHSQHIYITSDEEIKVGEYVFGGLNGTDVKKYGKYFAEDWEKIIMTTDPTLIADGVQAIDDEFLEWFVENPGCEYAEVKKGFEDDTNYGFNFIDYKITIPQEEPKQETTYSEEEVLELLHNYRNNFELYRNIQVLPNDFFGWFEKFKKK